MYTETTALSDQEENICKSKSSAQEANKVALDVLVIFTSFPFQKKTL
jgi:hypothetical protein